VYIFAQDCTTKIASLALNAGETQGVCVQNDTGFRYATIAQQYDESVISVKAVASGAKFSVTGLKAGSTSVSFFTSQGLSLFAGKLPVTVSVGQISVTPASVSLPGGGAQQSVTASQPGFAGPFTATSPASGVADSCANIATIAPTSPTTFTVTSIEPGSCTVTITGGFGATLKLPITVSAI
jgi:hypothetical protein